MPLKILLLIALFGIPIAPTLWALQDIPRRRFGDRRRKLKWFLLVAAIPCLGALAYIILVRRQTTPCEPTLFETDQEKTEVQ
jgi:hypothetical protein